MSLPAPKLEARAEQEMDSFAQVQSRMSDNILEELKLQTDWLSYIGNKLNDMYIYKLWVKVEKYTISNPPEIHGSIIQINMSNSNSNLKL